MTQVLIIKKPDDQLANWASIGGNDEVGYYLVYRGDPDAVLKMLALCLEAARQQFADKEPPVDNS